MGVFFIMTCVLTLNVGRHPTGRTSEAWNVEKLISPYAARKKFDMSGAMALSSAMMMQPKAIIKVKI